MLAPDQPCRRRASHGPSLLSPARTSSPRAALLTHLLPPSFFSPFPSSLVLSAEPRPSSPLTPRRRRMRPLRVHRRPPPAPPRRAAPPRQRNRAAPPGIVRTRTVFSAAVRVPPWTNSSLPSIPSLPEHTHALVVSTPSYETPFPLPFCSSSSFGSSP